MTPLMFGAWVAVAVLMTATAGLRRADGRVRERILQAGAPPSQGGALALARRPRLRRLGERLRNSRWFDGERLRERLVRAGLDDEAAGRSVAVAKTGSAVIGALMGLAFGSGAAQGAILSVVLAVAGFRLPDFRLARRAAARQEGMSRSAPDLLDLVAAGVSAGLGPAAALSLAAGALRGPLADELRRAAGTVAIGARWGDAMDELAARTGVDAIARLRTALSQTDRLGAGLEPVLRDLAADARGERRARAEARARAAPVKLLFPLVLLILPAFLLLTVVPVVLATLRNL